MSDTCKHCKRTIVRINYALGPRWMHTLPGGRYDMEPGAMHAPYEVCRSNTTAEPGDAA